MSKCTYCTPNLSCNRHRPCLPECLCGRHGQAAGTSSTLVRDPERPIGYRTKHGRVYKVRGKASAHDCSLCTARAHHWSWIHGTDGMDPFEHFRPLCRKCHYAYDEIHKKIAPAIVESNRRRRGKKGKPLSEEARAKVSAARRGKPLSPEHKAKIQASSPSWSEERRAGYIEAVQRPKSAAHKEKIRQAMIDYHERRRARAQG